MHTNGRDQISLVLGRYKGDGSSNAAASTPLCPREGSSLRLCSHLRERDGVGRFLLFRRYEGKKLMLALFSMENETNEEGGRCKGGFGIQPHSMKSNLGWCLCS